MSRVHGSRRVGRSPIVIAVLVSMCLALGLAPLSSASAGTTDTDGDGLTNAFERAYGLDPTRADTNGDGLLDPAEDLDHDGLSNLAEQRLGTNPTLADTNGNGVNDGSDDANGDGVADWREQDDRPLPDPIIPALDNAAGDVHCYQPGIGSTGKCVGDPQGKTLVALYGDSHSGQWIAGLDRYARSHGWRLVGYAKSGCPSVHVAVIPAGAKHNADCEAWREQTERSLRHDPPRIVIVSNYSHSPVKPKDWSMGLKALLAALPKQSRVIVLADTPRFAVDVPVCLEQNPDDVGKCEVARSSAYLKGHDRLEAADASAAGDVFRSMNALVCPTRLCPAVVGHLLLWRDGSHLTPAYSRQLAPALGALIRRVLASSYARARAAEMI